MSALRTLLLVVVCASAIASAPGYARRLPAPGGKVSVALPAELVGATTEAHLYAPLIERVAADDWRALAEPTSIVSPGFRSTALSGLAANETFTQWKLTPLVTPSLVADALMRCLARRAPVGDAGSTSRTAGWPADVIAARNIKVDVDVSDVVTLRFSQPVGPLPELLAGCALKSASTGPTGGYLLVAPGTLTSKSGAVALPPLLGVVELTGPQARADLVAFGAETAGMGTLLAPFPDVIVLVQSASARKEDLLGLRDATFGMRGFRQGLRADLLAAAYASGRGASTEGLLPPGVAPARPLPEPQGAEKLTPLSLQSLPSTAPRITVYAKEGDMLVAGVVERLAVLLRSRGTLVDQERARAEPLNAGIEVMRWRPPVTDPALALLSLVGARTELIDDAGVRKALVDPRLLSAQKEERVAAALVLERAIIDGGLAVPLMTADRWFTIDPELRGVTVRADGVPLLGDAYFAGAR